MERRPSLVLVAPERKQRAVVTWCYGYLHSTWRTHVTGTLHIDVVLWSTDTYRTTRSHERSQYRQTDFIRQACMYARLERSHPCRTLHGNCSCRRHFCLHEWDSHSGLRKAHLQRMNEPTNEHADAHRYICGHAALRYLGVRSVDRSS
jgi:hypothetical protein